MAINRTPPLDERIASVRADAAAYIDAATHEERKRLGPYASPFLVVRRDIVGGRDDLDAYLHLKAQEDKARETAA
jgi:hypothetical protein